MPTLHRLRPGPSITFGLLAGSLGFCLWYLDDVASLAKDSPALHETFEIMEGLVLVPGLAVLAYLMSERMIQREALHQRRLREEEQRRFVQLGRLAGAVAHEVTNPLHNLGLLAEDLADRLAQANDAEGRATLQRMQANVARLSQAVDTIYALARPSPMDADETAAADLAQAVAEWRGEHARWASDALDIQEPGPCRVAIQARALAIIIGNLLRNAVQAALERGGRVEVRADCADGHARLVIHNPGQLPAALTADAPVASTKPDGLGLGLFVSRQLVAAAAGSLELRQDGAVVECRLVLPLAEDDHG